LTRTDTAPEPAELTSTRHSLRQAIARCDRARRDTEAAATVVGRLNDIVTEYDQLSAELRELCARDERHRGEWIAGGRIGPDPGQGHDRQTVAGKLTRLTEECAAARRVLPAKEEHHRSRSSTHSSPPAAWCARSTPSPG
jgi:hypothetical protein